MIPNPTPSPVPGLRVRFTLQSDAAFAQGGGSSAVDTELDFDVDGLPLLRGRTLKGLLNEECANILYTLRRAWGAGSPSLGEWEAAAARLFGAPGSTIRERAQMRYGNAQLPAPLRAALRYAQRRSDTEYRLRPAAVRHSLTVIRRQTALDAWGAPRQGTLRSIRVVLRQTVFEAELEYRPRQANPAQRQVDLALLAACVKGWRRAGTARNRGLGRLCAALLEGDEDVTQHYFGQFRHTVLAQTRTTQSGPAQGDADPVNRGGRP